MTKTTLPEPCFRWPDRRGVHQDVYTKQAMEAYANERVREALEEASKTVMDAPITAGMLDNGGAKALAIHANSRIRALIQQENKS